MNSDEQIRFCADIIKAARSMGMGLRETIVGDEIRFDWVDPLAQVVITGPQAKDKINALELACHRLVDHLKFNATNPNETNQGQTASKTN